MEELHFDEIERLDKYQKNGSCPIDLGDRIASRFIVLHKLGHGGFGTVWLVRDEQKRHGRYVALKVIAAASSDEHESSAINQLRGDGRHSDHHGCFLLELERVFHSSRNGRHLCQVFPVVGPTLYVLNGMRCNWLYACFVKPFARQLVTALDNMHSLGVCHGDLTLKNVAVRLDKPLDTLTEQQLGDIFGEPRRRSLDPCFRDRPSPGPTYAVESVDLSRLPAEYLSTKLCILDFDEAFLANSPPRGLAHIPAPYLAPESIFSLTNGPEGDIWALGCILYSLRRSASQLFWDFFASGPMATAIRMHEVLGPVPQEWYTFPFLKMGGHPVHGPRQPDTEYRSLEDMHMGGPTLEQLVSRIVEPRRPANSTAPRTGAEKFCIEVPEWDMDDDKGESEFTAKHTTPIQQEDAKLFVNLLRQIFTYDHRKRITAKQVLKHPWMVEPGQKSRPARPDPAVQKLPVLANPSKPSTQTPNVAKPPTPKKQSLPGKKKEVKATAQTGKSQRGPGKTEV